jgi:protein-S-isoprenylcysteine O-methyltransferase Ste14
MRSTPGRSIWPRRWMRGCSWAPDSRPVTAAPYDRPVTPLIEHDSVAGGLVWGSVAVSFGSEIVATFVGRSGAADRTAATFDRGTKQIALVAILGGIAAAWIIGKHTDLGTGANAWPALVVAVALILLGGAVRTWAVIALGRFFRREVTIEEGQTVVRRGPYRLIRHPAYLGTIVSLLGIGLALGGWLGAVAAAAITFVGFLPRIRVEEAALTNALGQAYRDYASTTARLVPRVW